jgi:hypothetical protein
MAVTEQACSSDDFLRARGDSRVFRLSSNGDDNAPAIVDPLSVLDRTIRQLIGDVCA